MATHNLHTVLNTKVLRKDHISDDDVIELSGGVKEHYFELKLIIEAFQMEYADCPFNEGISKLGHYKEVYNGYGNIFTTTPHVNDDKSALTQIFMDNCILKGEAAVPILLSNNGSTLNLIISVNQVSHEITRKRLIGLSTYIKNVLATNELVKIPKNGFGRRLQKYNSFLKRISQLLDN